MDCSRQADVAPFSQVAHFGLRQGSRASCDILGSVTSFQTHVPHLRNANVAALPRYAWVVVATPMQERMTGPTPHEVIRRHVEAAEDWPWHEIASRLYL